MLEVFRPTRAVWDMENGHTQDVDWRSVVAQILYYGNRAQPQDKEGS